MARHNDHYAYRVIWSEEDGEYVGLCAEFPGLTGEQMDLFRRMEPLYRDWNSRINVISRKDIDGFYEHHVLHSLAIASYWLREGILPASLSPCASSASSSADCYRHS